MSAGLKPGVGCITKTWGAGDIAGVELLAIGWLG
jgi:hypothetical protein